MKGLSSSKIGNAGYIYCHSWWIWCYLIIFVIGFIDSKCICKTIETWHPLSIIYNGMIYVYSTRFILRVFCVCQDSVLWKEWHELQFAVLYDAFHWFCRYPWYLLSILYGDQTGWLNEWNICLPFWEIRESKPISSETNDFEIDTSRFLLRRPSLLR